jgi:hypothetical protein
MNKLSPKFLTFLSAIIGSLVLTLGVTLLVNSSAAQERKFTGNENHMISLDVATRYVQNFSKKPTAPTIKGGYFGRNIFERILSQDGCVGIRCYYAKTDSGESTLVLVGVDSTGNDLVQGTLGESIIPCPPWCLGSSPLNK